MEELTYDPVLDSQPLPRWRLLNPLRPPAPGRALVLVPDSGAALTVRPGEEIPAARFGAYQSVYTVDMTEHRLILDIALLSRDATFSFRSRVDVVCRVADPAEVVARGIRDMSGALYGHLRGMLRRVAREYDIGHFHEAEEALNAAVRDFTGDSAVRLRGIRVELLVDEDEIAASGRAYRDVVRETRLDGMRRDRHLDLIRDEGVEGLIAEIMEKEGARAALAWIEKGEADKREARLQAMRMVLERGDAHREPFEQAELERAVVEEVLGDGGGAPFGGPRRGRLRGALAAGRATAPEPETPEAAPSPAAHPTLRGDVVRPRPARMDGPPPEDEPVPAADPAPTLTDPAPTPADPAPAPRFADAPPPPAPPTPAATPPRPSDPAPPGRVSRVRGTAKRPPGGTGTGEEPR
ncbi:hypothetical protein [Streptomyces sp. XD-27]|uniref:hypothetical protein n=1 Tax=Streptomyces sp. XD-27 TaxID=3062779 RepID=UPI0026F474FD|nr:hypothetical protein [Streptomyces sp. XD-27]WKX73098.1 hypothetical protein Q3Y56_27245 [Streptomyces sp. XD-27]